MPNSDPWDRSVYPYSTLMPDSYIPNFAVDIDRGASCQSGETSVAGCFWSASLWGFLKLRKSLDVPASLVFSGRLLVVFEGVVCGL